jgi:hypothetical protein
MVYKKHIDTITAVLPLLLGGLIYICFREKNILFFSWLQYFNINDYLFQNIYTGNNIILKYFIYSLPNGLWILSGLLILKLFLKNEYFLLSIYSIVFIVISFIIEIGQLFKFVRGTFDILDIITIALFSIIGLIIIGEKYEKI